MLRSTLPTVCSLLRPSTAAAVQHPTISTSSTRFLAQKDPTDNLEYSKDGGTPKVKKPIVGEGSEARRIAHPPSSQSSVEEKLEDLKEKAHNVKEMAADALHKVTDKVGEKAEQLKESAKEAKDKIVGGGKSK
ncbi:hypothetical protein M3Y95_01069900 [Aphelenchoides besseyi]|nr:hypothetical protein M3Y95_01069900 [Aphelenchoides besseyi]